ncbi:Clavaminate synthase [Fusarium mundagurra]|uniref:Clavaminate synthase n=1 Tax=Fusarium mundagurra TaxID=1567541 RepID=A0A8H5Z3J5_9HYPO|nr:Clavaminate synthase [Fusarium mundagurra]
MGDVCGSYYPSEIDTQRFWVERDSRAQETIGVPEGFPHKLDSTLAWTRDDIHSRGREWRTELSVEDVAVIEAAANAFQDEFGDLSQISPTTFKLPVELSDRLRQLSDNIYKRNGFQIISGLVPSKADLSGHVINVRTRDNALGTIAPAFSDSPLSFHTDHCEVLSFYYRSMPATNGRTVLSSSWQVYNELAATRPDLLHALTEPWVLDSYPILGWQRKRNPELPSPTHAQLEALDAVQFIAQKNAITLPVTDGDITFINDMSVFHAREGFQDGHADTARHLLKMYLRDPVQQWEVPDSVQESFSLRYTRRPNDLTPEIWDIEHVPGLEELSFVNG